MTWRRRRSGRKEKGGEGKSLEEDDDKEKKGMRRKRRIGKERGEMLVLEKGSNKRGIRKKMGIRVIWSFTK